MKKLFEAILGTHRSLYVALTLGMILLFSFVLILSGSAIGNGDKTGDSPGFDQVVTKDPNKREGNGADRLITYPSKSVENVPDGEGNSRPASQLDQATLSFAVIGDFGNDSEGEAQVAALVQGWNPDFVITTGDNNYPDGESGTIDANIGQYYSQFIGDYQGSYGSGSGTNRFWPSLGNHDWHTITCTGSACDGAYFDFFTLPDNERYYDADLGLVHLFALNSNGEEPDGRNESSTQANWLKNRLAASTACYNLVYFHHPPYSSGHHGSSETMRWPFSSWGADAVLSGHDHMYERIDVGSFPYFVNGAGGAGLYAFENIGNLPPEATSIVRYNEDHGAMLVTATSDQINYQFYNTSGVLIDDYTVPKMCESPTPTPTFTPTSTGTPTSTPAPSSTPGPDALTIHVPGDAETIQAGIDLASDGDIVLVAPGTYYENLTIADKTITLASEFSVDGDASLIDTTIIDGGGATVLNVGKSAGPDTRIIGFTIQNGDDGINASAKLHILNNHFLGNKDAIDYESHGGGFCRDNIFQDNSDDAVDLDGSSEAVIEDNTIINSGDDGVEIRLNPFTGPILKIVIRRNIISGSGEDGIQLIGYDVSTERVFLIERNLILDSAMAGLGLMDNQTTKEDFRGAALPERIYLFNNTFVNNDYSLAGGANLVAVNNIFTDSITLGLKNLTGDSIAAYNLFWGNGTDYQNSNIDTGTTLMADPVFDANDLLLPGSPAIDAGAASYTWNSEIVLDLQPEEYSGVAPDLGAYESISEELSNPKLFMPFVLR